MARVSARGRGGVRKQDPDFVAAPAWACGPRIPASAGRRQAVDRRKNVAIGEDAATVSAWMKKTAPTQEPPNFGLPSCTMYYVPVWVWYTDLSGQMEFVIFLGSEKLHDPRAIFFKKKLKHFTPCFSTRHFVNARIRISFSEIIKILDGEAAVPSFFCAQAGPSILLKQESHHNLVAKPVGPPGAN